MSENGVGHNGADSDTSQNGEEKVCRDFVRNVCNRGRNCKFIHPENVKIRTEPIFCHDYQQSKCFRSTCKFIHCTREDEEHYKQTGELPAGVNGADYYDPKQNRNGKAKQTNGSALRKGSRPPLGGNRVAARNSFNGRGVNGSDGSEIPVCKDYLKGVCDRPPGGCKFRHVNPAENYGAVQNRRRGGSQSYYDSGPELKRNRYSSDFDDFGSPRTYSPPPPPPPPSQAGYSTSGYSTMYPESGSQVHNGAVSQHGGGSNSFYGGNSRNGYLSQHNTQTSDVTSVVNSYTSVATVSTTAAAMKALEDENFMLKRRIEELKKQVSDLVATNEYLLSQNAHLRLSNMSIPKEVQVQGVSAGGPTGSVVQTLVSMSQPIGINSSLSGATQPMSTITSLPTVSITPVSMSQPLPIVSMAQHSSQPQTVYPLVTTQGVIPPN